MHQTLCPNDSSAIIPFVSPTPSRQGSVPVLPNEKQERIPENPCEQCQQENAPRNKSELTRSPKRKYLSNPIPRFALSPSLLAEIYTNHQVLTSYQVLTKKLSFLTKKLSSQPPLPLKNGIRSYFSLTFHFKRPKIPSNPLKSYLNRHN